MKTAIPDLLFQNILAILTQNKLYISEKKKETKMLVFICIFQDLLFTEFEFFFYFRLFFKILCFIEV